MSGLLKKNIVTYLFIQLFYVPHHVFEVQCYIAPGVRYSVAGCYVCLGRAIALATAGPRRTNRSR